MAIKILILMATTTSLKMAKIRRNQCLGKKLAGQCPTGTTANGRSKGEKDFCPVKFFFYRAVSEIKGILCQKKWQKVLLHPPFGSKKWKFDTTFVSFLVDLNEWLRLNSVLSRIVAGKTIENIKILDFMPKMAKIMGDKNGAKHRKSQWKCVFWSNGPLFGNFQFFG